VGAGLVLLLVVGAFLFWLYRLGIDGEEELEDQEGWESEDPGIGESGDSGAGA
jgi:hypothetical protein